MNYQEWQHSAFPGEQRSCQSCHMPVAEGPVRAASVLGDERDSLAQHVFVGGNAFMVRMLNRYRVELGVAALPAELEATANATVRLLRDDTARLALSAPRLDGGTLGFDVEVRNLTGHKFPTGYPARRTWLHVTVRDRLGSVVFESGAIDAAGAIAGNDSDADPLAFEPHYQRITQPGEVQIYEPILGDPKGVPTTGLLTATQYLKDNRLLPRGFDKATAPAAIAVRGGAADDPDFGGGARSRALRHRRVGSRALRRRGGAPLSVRSASAGRTTSSATTPPNQSGSSRTTRRWRRVRRWWWRRRRPRPNRRKPVGRLLVLRIGDRRPHASEALIRAIWFRCSRSWPA